ncbi:MAG: hypothetical protein LBU16_06425 [Treponema sp.]|jgi:hypothetical protein|nr:hypothetical protein [Treponema sp.]
MKRCAVFVVIFVTLAAAVHGETIDKSLYKEITLTDYAAAGDAKERTDTELFKMEFKFVLQAANSVAVQDVDNTMHRFSCEEKLGFERGAHIVLYISSTHSEEGYWEIEAIDLAELKADS